MLRWVVLCLLCRLSVLAPSPMQQAACTILKIVPPAPHSAILRRGDPVELRLHVGPVGCTLPAGAALCIRLGTSVAACVEVPPRSGMDNTMDVLEPVQVRGVSAYGRQTLFVTIGAPAGEGGGSSTRTIIAMSVLHIAVPAAQLVGVRRVCDSASTLCRAHVQMAARNVSVPEHGWLCCQLERGSRTELASSNDVLARVCTGAESSAVVFTNIPAGLHTLRAFVSGSARGAGAVGVSHALPVSSVTPASLAPVIVPTQPASSAMDLGEEQARVYLYGSPGLFVRALPAGFAIPAYEPRADAGGGGDIVRRGVLSVDAEVFPELWRAHGRNLTLCARASASPAMHVCHPARLRNTSVLGRGRLELAPFVLYPFRAGAHSVRLWLARNDTHERISDSVVLHLSAASTTNAAATAGSEPAGTADPAPARVALLSRLADSVLADRPSCAKGRHGGAPHGAVDASQPYGIVICAGGATFLAQLFALLSVLREELRSIVPVLIAYAGSPLDEAPATTRALFATRFAPLHFVDLLQLPPPAALPKLTAAHLRHSGFSMKPYVLAALAASHGNLKELRWHARHVMMLDADVIPVTDPGAFIVEILGGAGQTAAGEALTRAYTRHGHLLWPDLFGGWVHNELFAALGISAEQYYAGKGATLTQHLDVDSGQLLFDLAHPRTATALRAAWLLNSEPDVLYRFAFGDKDTYRLGLILAGELPHEVQLVSFEAELLGTWVATSEWHLGDGLARSAVMCGRAMVQHHPVTGAALFVHHTLSKRRVPLPWPGCAGASAAPGQHSPQRLDPSIAPLGGRKWREHAFLVDKGVADGAARSITARSSAARHLGKLGPPGPHCITSSQQLTPVPAQIARVERFADGAMRALGWLATHNRSWLPCCWQHAESYA